MGTKSYIEESADLNLRRATWRCILILFLASLITGLFACELNRVLYTHHHPFYDSLMYHDKLFKVMHSAQTTGFDTAIQWACFTNSTNCLPFIVAAIVSPLVEPSRMVGVWIQTGLLFLLLVSVFWYLSRVRKIRCDLALLGSLAFLTPRSLFLYNGGLSDFRMDLSLFLTFGLTAIWFFTAMRKPNWRNFILLGVAASIACLFRATAPVYLLITFLPLFLLELFRSEHRLKQTTGGLLSIAIVVVLTGWFYYWNFDYLKYYYVEWNTDANAKIPLTDAMEHFSLAQSCVGNAFAFLIASIGIVTMVVTRFRKETIGEWISRAWESKEIDLRIAWVGLAPILILVVRRAGLNGLVSMPAVFGLMLFFLLPLLTQIQRLNDRRVSKFAWFILGVSLLIVFARGWTRHAPDGRNTMAVNHHLIDLMVSDSQQNNRVRADFGVLHLSEMNSDTIFSTLLFDRQTEKRELYRVTIDGVELSVIPTFTLPAVADWKNTAGESDTEKIDGLMAKANQMMDFLILPDETTAEFLEQTKPYNVINQHLTALRTRIIDDPSWVKIADGIQTSDEESVEVYRKNR